MLVSKLLEASVFFAQKINYSYKNKRKIKKKIKTKKTALCVLQVPLIRKINKKTKSKVNYLLALDFSDSKKTF